MAPIRKRGRRGEGHLEPPKKGRPHWSLRIRINGEQRRIDLETTSATVAQDRRADAIANHKAQLAAKANETRSKAKLSVAGIRKGVALSTKASRTFPATAERYCKRQEASGRATWKEEQSILRRHVLPAWPGEVSRYQAQHVASLLDSIKGLARSTLLHVHSAINGVFELALLEGLIDANPCKQVQRKKLLPKRTDGDAPKVRVTLTPDEVETMGAWVHPEEQHRPATERLQGKLRVSFYVGLRHNEVASLRWEDFGAGFASVVVYRAKKKDPAKRRDEVDLSQLPELRAWLERLHKAAGEPSTGLLFPAMRDGQHATAGKSKAKGVSEADALRRLYKRAHGIEAQVTELRVMVDKRVKAGKRTTPVTEWKQVRELTERERLVLEGSEREAPVCFHASRHAWAQALDAAGLADEQIRELLDHENVRITQGYLRRIGGRAKVIPSVHKLKPRAPSAPAESGVSDQAGRYLEAESDISAHPVGFEPTTLGFEVRCSIQLS